DLVRADQRHHQRGARFGVDTHDVPLLLRQRPALRENGVTDAQLPEVVQFRADPERGSSFRNKPELVGDREGVCDDRTREIPRVAPLELDLASERGDARQALVLRVGRSRPKVSQLDENGVDAPYTFARSPLVPLRGKGASSRAGNTLARIEDHGSTASR